MSRLVIDNSESKPKTTTTQNLENKNELEQLIFEKRKELIEAYKTPTKRTEYWNTYKEFNEILGTTKAFKYGGKTKLYRDWVNEINRIANKQPTVFNVEPPSPPLTGGQPKEKESVSLAEFGEFKDLKRQQISIGNLAKGKTEHLNIRTMTSNGEPISRNATLAYLLEKLLKRKNMSKLWINYGYVRLDLWIAIQNGIKYVKITRVMSRPKLEKFIRSIKGKEDIQFHKQNLTSDEQLLQSMSKLGFADIKMEVHGKAREKGGFFDSKHTIEHLDLSPIEIYKESQLDLLTITQSCLITAIEYQLPIYYGEEQCKMITDDLRIVIASGDVSIRSLSEIAERIHGCIKLKKIDYKGKARTFTYGDRNSDNIFRIGLIKNHYFNNTLKFNITTYATNHYTKIKSNNRWWEITRVKNGRYKRSPHAKTSAFNVVRMLVKYKSELLEPIQAGRLEVNFELNKRLADKTLNYDPLICTRPLVYRQNKMSRKDSNIKYVKDRNAFKDSRYVRADKDTSMYNYEIMNVSRLKIINDSPALSKQFINDICELREKRFTDDGDKETYVKTRKTIMQKTVNNSLQNIVRTIPEPSKGFDNGRRYTRGIGIQEFCRETRGLMCKGNYIDIDMINSHPNMCLLISNELNLPNEQTERYVRNREQTLDEIKRDLGCDRDKAKNIMLQLLNGQELYESWSKVKFLVDYKDEIDNMVRELIKREPEEYEKYEKLYKNIHKSDNKCRPEYSYMNSRFSLREAEILRIAMNTTIESDLLNCPKNKVMTNMHDGFMVYCPGVDMNYAQSVIDKVNMKLQSKYSKDIVFKMKPIESDLKWSKYLTPEQLKATEMEPYSDDDITNILDSFTYKFGALDFEADTQGHKDAIIFCDKCRSKVKSLDDCQRCLDNREKSFKMNGHMKSREHKAYHCSLRIGDDVTKFDGKYCAKDMLESLEHPNYIIYAHNLTYDLSYVLEHMAITDNTIYFNRKFMTAECKYKKRDGQTITIIFKDSGAFINGALRTFPDMFDLSNKDSKDGKYEKEVFPYDLYRLGTYEGKFYKIKDALVCLKSDEDRKQFMANIERLDLKIGDEYFDQIGYCSYYCQRDVDILYDGMEIFRKQMFQVSKGNIDIDHYPSISSVSQAYLVMRGCFDGIFQLAGIPAQFIRKCVVGGRVTTADSKLWRCKDGKIYSRETPTSREVYEGYCEGLADFDAVSLYPSAMFRMIGGLTGKPKVIPEHGLNLEWLQKNSDHYFVEITITDVGIHRSIPVTRVWDSEGESAKYDDRLYVGNKMVVDRYTLEDLIKFQQVKYVIHRGYYFDEGVNHNLRNTMLELFSERLKYKKQGNKIEKVYKLLMNSAYGKTIMKPITIGHKFKNSEQEMIDDLKFSEINRDGAVYLGGNKWMIRTKEDVNVHYSMPQFGAVVLSMSKRIVNEVLYKAEDLGIKVLYTDTDSMHIAADGIDKLRREYRKEYHRELIGKNMGQFHSDFDLPEGVKGYNSDTAIAIETIILGKKIYFDTVRAKSNKPDEDDLEFEHTRMKGISKDSIRCHVEDSDEKIETVDIYRKLYNGAELEFDLANRYVPRFKNTIDLKFVSIETFKRKIKISDKETVAQQIRKTNERNSTIINTNYRNEVPKDFVIKI